MRRRKENCVASSDALCEVYEGWLKKERHPLIRNRNLSQIASIDCTHASHRSESFRSWASKSASPTMKESSVRFTNCIVTCIWADGNNRTPPIIFASCRDFEEKTSELRGRISAEERGRIQEYLARMKNALCLDDSQVVFLGREAGGKTFCAEISVIIRKFMEILRLACRMCHFSRRWKCVPRRKKKRSCR